MIATTRIAGAVHHGAPSGPLSENAITPVRISWSASTGTSAATSDGADGTFSPPLRRSAQMRTAAPSEPEITFAAKPSDPI